MPAQAIGLGHGHDNQDEAPTGRPYSLFVIVDRVFSCRSNLEPPRWGFELGWFP